MPKADTSVIFIHGLAKKPHPDKLAELWLWGLGRGNPRPDVFAPPNDGITLDNAGAVHAFNYYADVFYGEDYETELASYYESAEAEERPTEAADGADLPASEPVPANEEERRFLEGFERKLDANMAALPPVASAGEKLRVPSDHELARFVPPPLRKVIVKKAAMEAYYYLFNKDYVRADGKTFAVRDELRNRLLALLEKARNDAEKTVIVSHSMGTMVAYDVLRNCAGCPPVDTLFTLGSPLGVREVQIELAPGKKPGGKRTVDFPAATVRRWINVYDPLDPICGPDPRFANDYAAVNGRAVEDVKESNWGGWRHTITHYLSGTKFRGLLREALGA
jgi:hypothetical protein